MGVEFTRNYRDHSNDQGFQFEFCCDKCGNGWRSGFQTNKLGMAASFLRAAGSFFGGHLYDAARAGDHVKDALRGKAWDDAFAVSVGEGKARFKQCTKCGRWVCPDVCWNVERGLCEECAPDLREAAASIQAHVAVEQLNDKARKVDQTEGLDVGKKARATCPHCGAKVEGGKFCGGCGKALAAGPSKCSCGAEVPGNAKFCPECGAPKKP